MQWEICKKIALFFRFIRIKCHAAAGHVGFMKCFVSIPVDFARILCYTGAGTNHFSVTMRRNGENGMIPIESPA